jgi:hypothetical protein
MWCVRLDNGKASDKKSEMEVHPSEPEVMKAWKVELDPVPGEPWQQR